MYMKITVLFTLQIKNTLKYTSTPKISKFFGEISEHEKLQYETRLGHSIYSFQVQALKKSSS